MRCKMVMNYAVLAIAITALSCTNVRAQLIVAGDALVNLDATSLAAGPITTWTNAGTLGDFTAVGAPSVQSVNGANAVVFDGVADYFDGPLSVAGIEGASDVSIEAWVLNPAILGEETILAWGARGGPDGSNMSFNYGTNPFYGAVGHWGAPDLGWNIAPVQNEWHHLVYTYDGTEQRVYADGVLRNTETVALNVQAGRPIRLASQTDAGGAATGALRGSLALGNVRIHDGVLTEADVLNNYEFEKDLFPAPPVVPPVAEKLPLGGGPAHRYSFTSDGSDSVGGANGTLVNQTGAAAFAGGQLVLGNDGSQNSNANNGQSNGDYFEIPNGTVSGLGTSATIETWTTWSGAFGTPWQRIFDLGTSDGGEGLSGGGANSSYIFATPRSGDSTLRTGLRNGPTALELVADDNAIMAENAETHVAVVIDGEQDSMSLYVNGEFVASNQAHLTLADLNDNNNWLGRAQWPDTMYVGSYNEFRLYDYALTANQLLGNFGAGPDVVNVVPEPSGLVLLLLGFLGLCHRRRK